MSGRTRRRGGLRPRWDSDPTSGRSLDFYLFTLPAWQAPLGWRLTIGRTACAAAGFYLLITAGTRALRARDQGRVEDGLSPWGGLSATGAFLLLALAADVYVDRFGSLLESHTVFTGVNYTDAHVMLGGLLLVALALVVGAGIATVNAFKGATVQGIVGAVLPAAVCYAGLTLVGWYVGNFIVKPNELVREEPFHHEQHCRLRALAFGLDKFTQRGVPAETTVDAADPANNQATLQNIRLWDWHALQDTLKTGAGDSDVLRLSRYRYRPLCAGRVAARGDAGDA